MANVNMPRTVSMLVRLVSDRIAKYDSQLEDCQKYERTIEIKAKRTEAEYIRRRLRKLERAQ